MDRLVVGTFTKSVVLDVGRRRGVYAAASLDIEEVSVTSSPAQFSALDAGDLDVVFTSPDNVVAYRFLDENPLGRRLAVTMLAGLDRGLGLSLCLAPNVELEDLRGGVMGVDVPTSGFAFVAYALAERAGIERGAYTARALGSTPARATALVARTCDATILNAGNELRAVGEGARVIDSVASLGPYLGTVIAQSDARRDPAQQAARERFVAVTIQLANDLIEHEAEDVVVSARDVLELSLTQALAHVNVLRSATHGLVRDGVIPRDALDTLVTLRAAALPSPALESLARRWTEVAAPDRLVPTS